MPTFAFAAIRPANRWLDHQATPPCRAWICLRRELSMREICDHTTSKSSAACLYLAFATASPVAFHSRGDTPQRALNARDSAATLP